MALDFLAKEFLAEAKVIDADKGYISVPGFNLRMKPKILGAAAQKIAAFFNKDRVEVVHGIPHSGNYLATAVALALGGQVRLHASRKDQSIPAAWKDIYRQEVRSFTASGAGVDVFSGINLSFVKAGDRALVLDDVCARGETGYKIVKGLQARGVKVVGFAVLFDKVFQGGLELVKSLKVKVFACVRVKAITQTGKIHLWTG
jgi:xanthine phosphoribosyltransferase